MISITVTGYIDKQPDVVIVGQTPKIKFKVVDKQRVRNRTTGEYESHYESVSFECWGEDAQYFAERLTKGRDVEVMGHKPKTEKWESGGVHYTDVVYKLLNINFPFREAQQQSSDADKPNAPQATARQAPRYASRQPSAGQAQNQHDAEPMPRTSQRSYARTGQAPGKSSQAQQPVHSQPMYRDPRSEGQNQQGQQPNQSRFNRASGQGLPATQY